MRVSIVSVPPSGIASRALTARFSSTCSICPGSAFTLPQIVAGQDHELDVFTQQPLEHPLQAEDDGGQVDHRRLEHLLAAQGEQLARERRGAVSGQADLRQVGPQRVACPAG